MTVKVMRADRSVVEIPTAFMESQGSMLFYAEARDGVWVPKCDLAQYEAGRRPEAK